MSAANTMGHNVRRGVSEVSKESQEGGFMAIQNKKNKAFATHNHGFGRQQVANDKGR